MGTNDPYEDNEVRIDLTEEELALVKNIVKASLRVENYPSGVGMLMHEKRLLVKPLEPGMNEDTRKSNFKLVVAKVVSKTISSAIAAVFEAQGQKLSNRKFCDIAYVVEQEVKKAYTRDKNKDYKLW